MIRALALALALAASAAKAQDWGDLNGFILPSLTRSGIAERVYWLPNSADPAQATHGLGAVYEHIAGSAGNTTIAVGLFVWQGGSWAFAGRVNEVFGHDPRDVMFAADHVALITTMPGPDDPRCCPTVPTRWHIDYTTLTGQRFN